MQEMKANESTAEKRRMYFYLVDATDGITPELGEAGGQPELSYDGVAFTNTGGVLVAIGNGDYYVQLIQAEVNKVNRTTILGRYKSANTAEGKAIGIQVVDPMADVVEGTLTLKNVLRIILAYAAGKTTGGNTANPKFRDQADGKDRIDATVDEDGNRGAVVVDGS